MEKTKWLDGVWASFFISLIISNIIKAAWWPEGSLVILLPITWLVVQLVFGKWIAKYSKQDLFGRDKHKVKE